MKDLGLNPQQFISKLRLKQSWKELLRRYQGHPPPFVVGLVASILFSLLVHAYYQVPSSRIKESAEWVRSLHSLHEKTIDWRLRDRGEISPDDSPILLLTVDEEAVEKIGRWPWPRNKIAEMIQTAARDQVGLLGFDSVFSEPETSPGLTVLTSLAGEASLPSPLKTKVQTEIASLNHDEILAQAVKENKNRLVMGSYFDEQEVAVTKDGIFRPLFAPYQELCLDVAFADRPDFLVLANDKPEIFVQDPSTTELPSSVIELLKHLLAMEDEKARAVPTATPVTATAPVDPEVESRARHAQTEYCHVWLTDKDPYLASEKELWPQLQAADKSLTQTPFEDFRTRLQTSPDYRRNPIRAMDRLWTNVPQIAQSTAHTGYFNAFLSLDGSVRRSNLLARYGTHLMPSLALRLAQQAKGLDLSVEFENDPIYQDSKRIKSLNFIKDGQPVENIPVDESGALAINYAGPSHMFPHLSVAQFLSSQSTLQIERRRHGLTERIPIPRSSLKNKILIFGATAIGIFDLRVSPFDENFPGLETHANILQNILDQSYLRTTALEPVIMPWLTLAVGIGLSYLLSEAGAIAGLFVTLLCLFIVYVVDRAFFFQKGVVTNIMFPLIMIFFVDYLLLTLYKYFTEERKKRELKGTFQKYVSPQIVEQILRAPENLELGGKKQRMSVIFSDVRGFTTISEKLEATELSDVLNLYLSPMTRLVFKHKGTLDKYMGDAIMAFFGAPISYSNHAECACRCALDMMKGLKELHAEFEKRNLPFIDIGIGINTGDMSVGNMGSDIVRSYTVMGDAVNLGSRLEGINKTYGTHIIISEFTNGDVHEKFVTREIDWVLVKGKHLPVKIYELRREGKPSESEIEFLAAFRRGTDAYHARDFDKAKAEFENALLLQLEDPPSRMYIARCEAFSKNPPPADWDGVFEMKEK